MSVDGIYKRLRKFLNPAQKGKVVDAMLYALAAGDNINEMNIVAMKEQLFIMTASGIFLEKLMARLGIVKPPGIGISDDLFRQMGITITNRKLVTNVFLDVLEIFYGADAIRANVLSGNPEDYNLIDGMTLIIQPDFNPIPLTITFQASDFSDISQATAEEVAGVISRLAFNGGYTLTASAVVDTTTGETYVQLLSGSRGPRSSVTVIGGSAQNILNFPARSASTPMIGTQFSMSFVGEYVRFTWTAGPNPNVGFVSPGDYVNIFGPQFLASNQGVFTISNVQDGNVGDAYFEIINPNFQVQGPATLNAVGGDSGGGSVIATASIDPIPTGAVRSGGVTTITTLAPHGFLVGQEVTISGVDNTTFNGTFLILSAASNTFTYSQLGADTTSGRGIASVSYGVATLDGAVRVSGVSTITTTTAHNLQVGQLVMVENVGDSSFDTTATITGVTSTTFTYSQMASNDLVFFTPVRQTIQSQARYASVYEVNPYEVVIFMPITTAIVTRQLQGAWHVHGSALDKTFLGSYCYDPNQGFPVSQYFTTLTQTINKGTIQTVGFGFNTSEFPDTAGYLLFEKGTSNQEGPVKYLGRPSDGSLLIDPAYKFQKTHLVGSSVNLLNGTAPYLPTTDGSDYPTYATGTDEGQVQAQALIQSLTASGIFLNIIIVYPKAPGWQSIPPVYDGIYNGTS
jgi:hypothetical protein